jgi:hypothetical protein
VRQADIRILLVWLKRAGAVESLNQKRDADGSPAACGAELLEEKIPWQ